MIVEKIQMPRKVNTSINSESNLLKKKKNNKVYKLNRSIYRI